MKGIKYSDFVRDYDEGEDDVRIDVPDDFGLEEQWGGVVRRWRQYIKDYSLEMLANYDEGLWSDLLPDWVGLKTSKENDGGWV